MTICRCRRSSSSTVCLLQRRYRRLYATVENSSSGSSECNVGIINVVIMKMLNSTIFFYNWSVSTRIRNGTTAFFIALGFLMVFCLMRCIDLCKSCFGGIWRCANGACKVFHRQVFLAYRAAHASCAAAEPQPPPLPRQHCCHHQILTTKATRNAIWLKMMFSPQLSYRPFSLVHA